MALEGVQSCALTDIVFPKALLEMGESRNCVFQIFGVCRDDSKGNMEPLSVHADLCWERDFWDTSNAIKMGLAMNVLQEKIQGIKCKI